MNRFQKAHKTRRNEKTEEENGAASFQKSSLSRFLTPQKPPQKFKRRCIKGSIAHQKAI